jgi:serine O-acetyltransferase
MMNKTTDQGLFKKFMEEASCYADDDDLNAVSLLYLIFLNSGFQLNLFYRATHMLHKSFGDKSLLWIIPKIVLYLERLFTSSYIDPGAKIGKRFKIGYGMNIVIGEFSEIGDDVFMFNGVTLGSTIPGLPEIKQPKIGNNVLIGSGAKILGGVTIGDNVIIGANAVVLESFGPNVTIAGVPAKVIKRLSDEK